MKLGKVAVLGGGPGGHAVSADLSLRGFEVHFWARDPWRAAAVFQNKKIRATGAIEGIARLAGASNNLAEIMKGAGLVIIPLAASTQHEMAERCAPYAEDGQVMLVACQGGLGSVEFANVYKEKKVRKDVLFAEYAMIPYGARFHDTGLVNLSCTYEYGVKAYGSHVGVFPAKRTEEAMEAIRHVFPLTPVAVNALACALTSRGINHQPVVTLGSLSSIDTYGYWDIMKEGMTPNVHKLVIAADDERKAVEAAWGFPVVEVYKPSFISGEKSDRESTDVQAGAKSRSKHIGAAWKDRITMEHRYVTEAVPFGLVPRASAARRAGVETPVGDSVIRLFSAINGVDYFKTGRTLESLGLTARGVGETNRLLYEGLD